MDGDSLTGIKIVREVGGAIAEAIDRSVKRELFFKTIDEDTVSAARLDELHAFCPCALNASADEHAKLSIVFSLGLGYVKFCLLTAANVDLPV